jgi:hypothetical protein
MEIFQRLLQYLKEVKDKEIILYYNEIEKIINSKLPNQAYIDKKWWLSSEENEKINLLIKSGWVIRSLDLGNFVIFKKKEYKNEKNKKKKKIEISEREIIDIKDLGEFYLLVRNFEIEFRSFLIKKLGKSYKKRIKNDLNKIFQNWEDKYQSDLNFGIDPELEIFNYASINEYIEILKKYDKLFFDNERDESNVISKLQDFANYGRNPIMHCRTITIDKFITTKNRIKFLKDWIKRRQ